MQKFAALAPAQHNMYDVEYKGNADPAWTGGPTTQTYHMSDLGR